MDLTNILYPADPQARAEFHRRFNDTAAESYREMPFDKLHEIAGGQPEDSATAQERMIDALLVHAPEAHDLLAEAAHFAERSVRAVEKPNKTHSTLRWQAAWSRDFVTLTDRLRVLIEAHQAMTRAARTWRETPGLGEADSQIALALNTVARILDCAKGCLHTAGQSRGEPEHTAASPSGVVQ